MLSIKGLESADYFVILCQKCNTPTENEYLGGDPEIPYFRATCQKCGSHEWKLSGAHWHGLPLKLRSLSNT